MNKEEKQKNWVRGYQHKIEYAVSLSKKNFQESCWHVACGVCAESMQAVKDVRVFGHWVRPSSHQAAWIFTIKPSLRECWEMFWGVSDHIEFILTREKIIGHGWWSNFNAARPCVEKKYHG